ncbi:DEAD/DEAH box helicase [Hippea alviniae]|uniref:DEAD/DEAH box helicase n=1 Tax=Hippea alviniae TaxID=1279027 RepID=UPI0003B482E3|nr:DEAD/DEAH box helicase [Hippea alviniae]
MNFSYLAYRVLSKKKSSIIVLKDNSEVERLAVAFDFFIKVFQLDVDVSMFFSYEIPPHSSIKPSDYIISERLKSIYKLINSSKRLLFITNINALLQPVISADDFLDSIETIKKSDTLNIDKLFKKLSRIGYKKVERVYELGEFSRRGSIVDIFSPFYDKPLRIDLFDDEVESIRLIYPQNQRTDRLLEEAVILPASEYRFEDDEYGYCLLKDGEFLSDYPFDGFYRLAFIDKRDVDNAYRLIELYKTDEIFAQKEKIEGFLDSFEFEDDAVVSRLFNDSIPMDEKIKLLKSAASSLRVVVSAGSLVRLNHLKEYFSTKGIDFKLLNSTPFENPNGIYLTDLYLYEGFKDKENRIAFVSFGDLFGRQEIALKRPKRKSRVYKEFEIDSKVVHKRYGIALFKGLKRIKIDRKEEDFFELEFAEQDKIYLPVYNADLLLEYHGSEQLSSLRNNKWQKTQENIKKSIKKILTELVSAYAKRQLSKREPYNVELFEIKEFEALFEYDETPDQARAIEEVKRDMSKDVPMDRLVCGDVSFGKTEVAARAIAIAVFNYKQAVFMVPTTLLSLQHYRTLQERFGNFPVRIALLNRFTTKKEKDEILNGLKNGEMDILIATHSVYSDAIEFANLGLVVVDEEHKFGVKVKEYLKTRYPNVDMLYLSATPIPRTLNMALNSILDISVIKTPPLERKPIETIISKRKLSLIRDAVLREIARDGRVYFVHNAIEDIEYVKEELDNILPFVRKAIVHAKMPKKQIKTVFEEFNQGKFEMLISTSIIESGLDIKSVDTIIIDDADRFGLSDLYQLRGRVGRSDRTAYAYLLYRGKITQNAAKRLQYMEEFFERGSGFHLALKDMELRGYGNILGKDQSGKIKSIGFSTYMSLIEEAISEIKNQPTKRDVEIKHTFSAFIPDEFASNDDKVDIYRRAAVIDSLQKLEEFEDELKDRFGSLPEEVKNLIYIVSLKIKAKDVFVKKLTLSPTGVIVEFYVDADIDTDELVKVVDEKKGRFLSQTSVYFGLLGKNLKTIKESLFEIFDRIKKATAL